MTGLPVGARRILVATVLTALIALGVCVDGVVTGANGQFAVVASMGVLLLVANRFPLLFFLDGGSEAVSIDELILIVMIAMLPAYTVVVVVATAHVGVQVWRRRSLVKAAFNVATLTLSAFLSVVTAHAAGLVPGRITWFGVLGLAACTVVYFAVNGVLLTAMLNAMGGGRTGLIWRHGSGTRLLLSSTGLLVGLLCAIAAQTDEWVLVAVPIVYLVLRQALAGHFASRHDRDRLRVLLDAAKDVHGAMASGAVPEALQDAGSKLLRAETRLRSTRPGAHEIGASLPFADRQTWLVASRPSPRDPFDEADERMLSALTALGATAMTNSSLFGQVRHQREEIQAVLSSLAEGVCAFDHDLRPTFWNPVAARLLGVGPLTFDPADVVGQHLVAPVRRCLATGSTLEASGVFVRQNGTSLPVSYTCAPIRDGEHVVGAVLAFRDDTERLTYEDQLAHHAFHDQLTGLANRRLFLDRLDQALRRAARHPSTHAVLFCDIDRFKMINDNLGHQAGDRLLVEIAARLRRIVRSTDTVARFGGDEFTLLLEDVNGVGEVESMAERIVTAMQEPVEVTPDRDIVATMSIGVAVSRVDSSPDDLLHDADLAMYEAKAQAFGRWRHYAGTAGRSVDQIDLETALRRAIEQGAVEVHYQPIVGIDTFAPVDLEGLVRWAHPQQGLLLPARFIPLAEETGLIVQLSRLVLKAACQQGVEWQLLPSTPGVTVNLSARQFQDADLVNDVRAALDDSGLPPHRLCLEVTETLAMRDIDWTIHTLRRLKDLGVRLAIDDFGTGHSSLNYLKRFPVDVVKIDRCFVQDLDTSVVDTAIVAAIVTLSRTLRITPVAEGVETEDQRNRLQALGCPMIQGFLCGPPLPAAELTQWLQTAPMPEQFAQLADQADPLAMLLPRQEQPWAGQQRWTSLVDQPVLPPAD
jgi:diguanylate cyclase (GGDEF)-like protein